MKKTITSKVLSLFLTLMLLFGVFAAVQTASITALAKTITDGAGNQYEMNFATGGTTATQNGITATVDYEVDLSGDGWGWNPITQEIEKGERISFPVSFSGKSDEDGRLTVIISGILGNGGGIFEDTFDVFVKQGKRVENNLDNTLFVHLSMKAVKEFGSLTDISIMLDFESMPTYELYIANLDEIELNGVYFNFWAGTSGGGYCAAGEKVGLDLWASGTPLKAGVYEIQVFSEKAEVSITGRLSIDASQVGTYIDKDFLEDRDIEGVAYFIMPEDDVDDFVFSVDFTPLGGGTSYGGSSSKGSSGGGSKSGSGAASASTPVIKTSNDIKSMINKAKSNGKNIVTSTGTGVVTVQAAAWKELAGMSFQHTTSVKGKTEVRITISNPSAIKRNTKVSAYTTGDGVDKTVAFFQKSFSNTIRAIHFDQTGSWGQEVKIAAKINLANMSKDNLVFYYFDREKNTYKKLDVEYTIDKNGFIHFSTTYAGDIIVSNGELKKK